MTRHELTLGARLTGEVGRDAPRRSRQCSFHVWAPRVESVELHVLSGSGNSRRLIPMHSSCHGYFHVETDGVGLGSRYMYRLNGKTDRPDPASRFQPEGLHGPSEVITAPDDWDVATWRGVMLDRAVFYELHVGAFTAGGTFDDVIGELDRLRELGITIIELMPVSQFPGERNWGYDGALPFAVQNSYGGPAGLRRLIRACHERGLGVAMDVVYNHLGPEGNYLEEFGPYFTDKYHTPWGKAINFDDAHCDHVRRYFIENALMWIEEYHVDALRLDAVHAIFDQSAYPFLHELTDAAHEHAERLSRRVLVIGESDLNDPKLMRPSALGGWNMDATWSDDLHHALHALLTGERTGYYADFGEVEHLATALRDGYVYSGRYSAHRKRRHGAAAGDVPAVRHIVCSQNHDQVGNRARGDRLSTLVSFEQLKLAAGVVLLSPCTPLLFMGEEYGEQAPFQYFISHTDGSLVEAVRTGRAAEFAAFRWQDGLPDPQAEETFMRSKLDRSKRSTKHATALERYYRELLRLRNNVPAITCQRKEDQDVLHDERLGTILLRRGYRLDGGGVLLVMNFSEAERSMDLPFEGFRTWRCMLDSAAECWAGSGTLIDEAHLRERGRLMLRPHSIALLTAPQDGLP